MTSQHLQHKTTQHNTREWSTKRALGEEAMHLCLCVCVCVCVLRLTSGAAYWGEPQDVFSS